MQIKCRYPKELMAEAEYWMRDAGGKLWDGGNEKADIGKQDKNEL